MNSDEELMLQFKFGNVHAFDELVIRHQEAMFRFFRRMGLSHDDSLDHTQETFLKLFAHSKNYVPTPAKFTTYLYRIAKNSLMDRFRQTACKIETVSFDIEEWKNAPSYKMNIPHVNIEHQERSDIIMQAIQELPDDIKIIFILSESQDLKYSEIAETLSIPLGTVKSRMSLAIKKLRDTLKQKGITFE